MSYPPVAGPTAPAGGGDSQDVSMSLPTRGPKIRLLPIVLGLLGLGVVAAVAVGGWLLLSGGEPGVQVAVVQTDKGDALEVQVPEAKEGTKVRFSGEEKALEAGQARFALAPDDLHVGDNELSISVVDPGGDVTQVDVTLTLEYRVRADLSRLDADPPVIGVVVDAPAGSTVALDGEPVELDASGHAEKGYPLDAKEPSGPNPVLEHEVSYRVAPPSGEPATGTVRTRIPYATLQIDRPGDDVITDEETIEVAGAVHEDASVTIDGGEVKVTEGRFLYELPLPELGKYEPTIVAKRPARAPRRRSIVIRRVEDLEKEAASFAADPDLDYARISQNPNIYKGRKVELVGRVYNARIEGGEGMLQMLVRDCPRSKCPLWVTYSAAAEPSVDSWVRVLGEVAGEQQFRAESGEIMTVPRIAASFVLPAEE